MTMSPEFVAKMAELSAAFAVRTADDADEFEVLSRALESRDNRADRVRLQYLAHRLAGGSATFGLTALEAPACALEEALLADASVTEIGTLGRDMAQAIRQICPAPTSPSACDDATA